MTTPTQHKLIVIGQQIELFGVLVAILVFLTLIIHMFVKIHLNVDREIWSQATLQEFINHFSLAVALIIVGVPEGLPMAITLGLAFQLKKQNYYVRNLEASEKIGGVSEILISKTGSLTQNKDL